MIRPPPRSPLFPTPPLSRPPAGSAGAATAGQPSAPARPAADQPGAVPPADALQGQPAGTGPAAVLRIEPPTGYLLPSQNTRVSPRALKEGGTPPAPAPVTRR